MKNSFYKNKTVLITGATSGIGRELALMIAENDCTLLLLGRREERLREVKKLSEEKGSRAFIYLCDVSDKAQVSNAYSEMKRDTGKIDIAILNSGVSHRMAPGDTGTDKGENTFAVNFFGVVYFINELKKDFIEAGGGMIVGVSSLAETRGFPGSGYYCASKAALSIYLESLRVELQRYGIKVLTVKPGFVVSEMTDKNEFKMPFLMSTSRGASIIYRGLARQKKIIQFPFRLLILIKTLKLFPPFVYDRLGDVREFQKGKKHN